MTADSSLLPQGFDATVRLFPLSDVVFFPSTVLPLHVFESRYCEMMEEAVASDQLIAMATLLPGYEHDYHARPPVSPLICIGRVATYDRLEDGKFNLMLVGLQRARIGYEIEPVRSFRRAHVDLIDDKIAVDANQIAQMGERLAARILSTIPSAQQLVEEFEQGKISLSTLADVAAFHLPLPVDMKLRMLGEADVYARSQLLLSALHPADSAPHRNYPLDFSSN